jgi:hypothetical protein
MPIEIKELHIRVSVNRPETGRRPEGAGGTSAGAGLADEEARGALIAECVEQVLEILHRKTER